MWTGVLLGKQSPHILVFERLQHHETLSTLQKLLHCIHSNTAEPLINSLYIHTNTATRYYLVQDGEEEEDLESASMVELTPNLNSKAENILEKISLETTAVSSVLHSTAMALVA